MKTVTATRKFLHKQEMQAVGTTMQVEDMTAKKLIQAGLVKEVKKITKEEKFT